MTQRLMIGLIFLLNTSLVLGAQLSESSTPEVKKLIEDFQSVPAEYLFCSARGEKGERWERGGDSDKVLPAISKYFSAELLRLFSWIHCDQPEVPAPLTKDSIKYGWDIRYGLSAGESDDKPRRAISNIRTHVKKNKLGGVLLRVTYRYYESPNEDLFADYQVVNEINQWKIDDIALKGYAIDMGTMGKEQVLHSTKSLKTELKAAYRRAEVACVKDSKCRGELGK